MASSTKCTLPSPMSMFAPPGWALLNPEILPKFVGVLERNMVLRGMCVDDTGKLSQKIQFHTQCVGSVSPAMKVFESPSDTERNLIPTCRRQINPAHVSVLPALKPTAQGVSGVPSGQSVPNEQP